ncbi:MAG: diguanylate cyclase [Pseudomonadota bacterium]
MDGYAVNPLLLSLLLDAHFLVHWFVCALLVVLSAVGFWQFSRSQTPAPEHISGDSHISLKRLLTAGLMLVSVTPLIALVAYFVDTNAQHRLAMLTDDLVHSLELTQNTLRQQSMASSMLSAISQDTRRGTEVFTIVLDSSNTVRFASEPLVKDAVVNAYKNARNNIYGEVQNGVAFRVDHRTTNGKTAPFMVASSELNNGATIIVAAALQPTLTAIAREYQLGLLLVMTVIVISILAAVSFFRRIDRSIDSLHRVLRRFDPNVDDDTVITPPDTIAEFQPIYDVLRDRAEQLRKAQGDLNSSIAAESKLQRELEQTLISKEAELVERTRALKEANERLRDLSKTDALTSIPNRREFDEFEDHVWRLCAREGTCVAVILIDIDYFKPYNDSLGHQQGDRCLKQVAYALSKCATRPMDLVARYGGEEFVAVLGETDIKDALVVAERMRQTVERLAIAHPRSAYGVITVTIGVASIRATLALEADNVVKDADEALYFGKTYGRNVVAYRDGETFATFLAGNDAIGTTDVIEVLSKQA